MIETRKKIIVDSLVINNKNFESIESTQNNIDSLKIILQTYDIAMCNQKESFSKENKIAFELGKKLIYYLKYFPGNELVLGEKPILEAEKYSYIYIGALRKIADTYVTIMKFDENRTIESNAAFSFAESLLYELETKIYDIKLKNPDTTNWEKK